MGVTWGPLTWRHLDAAAAEALWTELVDWVEWLRNRYGLTHSVLPACWPNHPVAVEELTALMAAYTAAYQVLVSKDGAVVRYHDLLIGWHRGELWPCLDRLPKVARFGDCQADACNWRPPSQAPLDRELVDRAIDADLADREISETQNVVREATMAHRSETGRAIVDEAAGDGSVLTAGALWDYDPHARVYRRRDS